MKKKEVERLLIEAGLSYDRLIAHRDGAFTVKKAYFFHHGEYIPELVDKVLKAVPGAEILRADDVWATWPKTSYLVVKFQQGGE